MAAKGKASPSGQKPNPILLGVLGVLVVGVIAYYFVGGEDEAPATPPPTIEETYQPEQPPDQPTGRPAPNRSTENRPIERERTEAPRPTTRDEGPTNQPNNPRRPAKGNTPAEVNTSPRA